MPTDLLDRLQEDKLHGLEQLLSDYQAAATSGSAAEDAAAIADFFVDEAIGLRQSSARLWEHTWTMALAGKIANRQERGGKLRSLLERTGGLLARHAAAARAYAEAAGCKVARLDQLELQCALFPTWIEECMGRWEALDAPRKPLDRERINESQAAFQRGECEAVEDIVSQVRRAR